MGSLRRPNGFAHHYIDEMSSKIVAASGRPGDRYHLGKLILQGLRECPSFVSQVGKHIKHLFIPDRQYLKSRTKVTKSRSLKNDTA